MAEYDRDEPINPYAPPDVDFSRGPVKKPGAGTGPAEPFSASLVIGRTWEIYKARLGIVLSVVLGAIGVNWVYQYIGTEMERTVDLESTMGILGQIAFLTAGTVLQIWLTCGQTIALLKVAKGEHAIFGDLFQGGPYFLRYLGATLIYLLGFGAILGVCLAPAGLIHLANGGEGMLATMVALVVGGLFSVVFLIYYSVRLSQYPYVVIDRDAGAWEAIRESIELTRSDVFELTGLMFIGGVIAMSGILACGVGVFFTVPLSMLLFACTYVALTTGLPRDFYLRTGEIDGDDSR